MGTGGNRVGTAWEPGGNQVGARSGGSHWFPLGLHLGVSHAGGSKSEPGWGVGSKRGQTWSPRGPHGPNYVPTWFTRGPHMGPTWSPMVPTWSPRGPHCRHVVPVLFPPGSVPIDSQHGSHTAHAWSRPWVVLWEHLLCDIDNQALSLSLSH